MSKIGDLNFIQGDPENLEGKGVIYTHNTSGVLKLSLYDVMTGNSSNFKYPAIIFGTGPERVVDLLEAVFKSVIGTAPDKEFMVDFVRENPYSRELDFCITGIDPDKPLGGNHDLIEMPEKDNTKHAYAIIKDAFSLYERTYKAREGMLKDEDVKYSSIVPNYSILDAQSLGVKLSGICGNLYRTDNYPVTNIMSDVTSLLAGFEPEDVVKRFKKHILEKEPDPLLLDKYVRHIAAVHAQEYEEAGRLSKEIDVIEVENGFEF